MTHWYYRAMNLRVPILLVTAAALGLIGGTLAQICRPPVEAAPAQVVQSVVVGNSTPVSAAPSSCRSQPAPASSGGEGPYALSVMSGPTWRYADTVNNGSAWMTAAWEQGVAAGWNVYGRCRRYYRNRCQAYSQTYPQSCSQTSRRTGCRSCTR